MTRATKKAAATEAPDSTDVPVWDSEASQEATGDIDKFSGPLPAEDDDPFESADRPTFPRMLDLRGRLLLIKPHKFEPEAPGYQGGPPQPRVTATLIALDGGTLHYGGSPEDPDDPKPHTKHVETPHRVESMFLFGTALVNGVKGKIGTNKMVIGRLGKAKTGAPGMTKAWILEDPTDEDRALARKYINEEMDPFN